MRFDPLHTIAVLAAFLLLYATGCPEHTDWMGDDPADGDDDVTGDDDDTADDDDTSGDDDTADDDDTVASGYALEIEYIFLGFYDTADSCTEAWVDQLWLDATLDGVEQPQLVFPCDDAPILIEDVATGTWTLSLASVTDIEAWDQPYSGSDPVTAEVEDGGAETVTVTLELQCHENGWDDGCGGA